MDDKMDKINIEKNSMNIIALQSQIVVLKKRLDHHLGIKDAEEPIELW